MPYRDLEPVSKQLTIVIGLTVVGFMAFGLALSFYRNILFEETLQTMGAENHHLQDEIQKSEQDLEYYNSAQYKDKYSKESLGKSNPGEKVILIADAPKLDITGSPVSSDEEKQAKYEELLRQMPVIEHWNLYLFHRDELEQLKKGL